jgi:hypothetical protein
MAQRRLTPLAADVIVEFAFLVVSLIIGKLDYAFLWRDVNNDRNGDYS